MATTEFLSTVLLAAGAGIATFFSPCAYALLPGYVGYYVSATDGNEDSAPISSALGRGLAATGGVLIVFSALAVIVVLIGSAIDQYLLIVEILVGVALILLGLSIVFDRGIGWHALLPKRRETVLGFGLFGGMYAVAAAGCVAPLFLAIVLQSITLPTPQMLAVIGVYAGSFGLLMSSVTVATAVGHELSVNTVSGHADAFVRIAGVVLICAGIGQMYIALTVSAAG